MYTAYMIGLKNARTRIFARIEAISVRTFARKRGRKQGVAWDQAPHWQEKGEKNRRAKRTERQSGEGKGGGAQRRAFDAADRLNEIIDNKRLREIENQRGKRPNEKRQNLDSGSKHRKRNNEQSKHFE